MGLFLLLNVCSISVSCINLQLYLHICIEIAVNYGASSVHRETVLVRSSKPQTNNIATDLHVSRFEYLALFGSLILVLLETTIHLITWCLRQ